MKIEGKVILITGSSRGIGKDFTRVLLQKGAKVSISGTNDKVGRSTYEEFRKQHGDNVMYTNCDVRSEEAMADMFQKTFERYKRLDVVINNAGILNESTWEECVDINLKGTIRGTNLALGYMRKDKGGHGGVIINIASIAGLRPYLVMPSYAATKHGIVGFTKSWALHPLTIENGIRMNCLCPGVVDTDMSAQVTAHHLKLPPLMDLDKLPPTPKITAEQTSEGLLKLLEEESNNGRCLKIFCKEDKLVIEYDD